MPFNSVAETIRTAINGLTFPEVNAVAIAPPLEAWIAPPVVGDFAVAPQCYIWAGIATEHRQTMAGSHTAAINTPGAGFRDAHYQMDIWLKYALPNDDALSDSLFPVIIDCVTQALRAIVMPVLITDSITGWTTQLTNIGEDFDTTFGAIRELEDQRFWLYEAHIMTKVYEKIQQ